jgi:hypothetical protein
MKYFALISLAIFSILFLSACDPGISFVPEEWERVENQFRKSFDGFDLKIEQIGGLIGTKTIFFEGDIINRGKKANKFQIEKAILKTGGEEFTGDLNLQNNTIEVIKSGDKQHFSIYFELGKALYKVLKKPVELNVTVKAGEQNFELIIPMTDQWPSEDKK